MPSNRPRKSPLIYGYWKHFKWLFKQAEQFYTALKFLKQTVEFVRYPDESHGITRGGTPSRRFDHQARTRGWLERFLGVMGA